MRYLIILLLLSNLLTAQKIINLSSCIECETADTLDLSSLSLFLSADINGNDTLILAIDDNSISSLVLPIKGVSTISEMVTTIAHNGSGYIHDNGIGGSWEFGYYLNNNGDGTFELRDWTQSQSGDIIQGLPPAPVADGTYTLTATVISGVTTYTWQ